MFQFTQPYNNDCVHLHKNAQRVIQWTGSGTTSTLPSNNRVGVALLYTRDRIGCHGIREASQLHGGGHSTLCPPALLVYITVLPSLLQLVGGLFFFSHALQIIGGGRNLCCYHSMLVQVAL